MYLEDRATDRAGQEAMAEVTRTTNPVPFEHVEPIASKTWSGSSRTTFEPGAHLRRKVDQLRRGVRYPGMEGRDADPTQMRADHPGLNQIQLRADAAVSVQAFRRLLYPNAE